MILIKTLLQIIILLGKENAISKMNYAAKLTDKNQTYNLAEDQEESHQETIDYLDKELK